MAVGLPVKANYAAGDILTATNMNDLSGTFNNVATSYGNAAGKNKIINGDMGIWQRGTSIALGGGNTYTADRWGGLTPFGDSVTASQQTFTAGAAPVTGYEGTYFLRFTRASGTSGYFFSQKVEDVRTFAGQTVTMSFWAKASVGFTPINIYAQQNFGSGGSSAVTTNPSVPATITAITTSWVRYTYTYNIPSITGKTIGTSSSLEFIFAVNPGTASSTVDIWGGQLEAGSVATAFQTASGGSIQSELAMCQRYFQVLSPSNPTRIVGGCISSTRAFAFYGFPVEMRTTATATFGAAANYLLTNAVASGLTCSSVATFVTGSKFIVLDFNVAIPSVVAGDTTQFILDGASSTISISAEL